MRDVQLGHAVLHELRHDGGVRSQELRDVRVSGCLSDLHAALRVLDLECDLVRVQEELGEQRVTIGTARIDVTAHTGASCGSMAGSRPSGPLPEQSQMHASRPPLVASQRDV